MCFWNQPDPTPSPPPPAAPPPPVPASPPPPPQAPAPQVQAAPPMQAKAPDPAQADYAGSVRGAQDKARKAAASRQGRQSTILTGGQGLEEGPYVRRKTVLGA